jgi:hypothetical protein
LAELLRAAGRYRRLTVRDYILTLLFVKYVTYKAKSDPNSLIDVPAGGSFYEMVALKDDTEIGDRINESIRRLAAANELERVNRTSSTSTTRRSSTKARRRRMCQNEHKRRALPSTPH